MFLRCKRRRKDGKEHLYWSVVENRRIAGGRVLQLQVLYLGELNGRQESAWRKTVEIFAQGSDQSSQVALFDEHFAPTVSPAEEVSVVAIQLSKMRLLRPRQWGACWLGCELWSQLGLDSFWLEKLPPGRQGTRWDKILQVLTLYRLIGLGSECHLHCQWFQQSALADLLGETSLWRKSTDSMNATTKFSYIERRFSTISPSAGGCSSPPNTRCFCTI